MRTSAQHCSVATAEPAGHEAYSRSRFGEKDLRQRLSKLFNSIQKKKKQNYSGTDLQAEHWAEPEVAEGPAKVGGDVAAVGIAVLVRVGGAVVGTTTAAPLQVPQLTGQRVARVPA